MKLRDPYKVVLFSGLTFGLYFVYWLQKTKNDLNELENKIPNILLIFIPIINFYFWYKFFFVFSKHILKNKISPILLTLLFIIYPYLISLIIVGLNLSEKINLLAGPTHEANYIVLFKLLSLIFFLISFFALIFLPSGIMQFYINKKIE
jgi:hypothetical protein